VLDGCEVDVFFSDAESVRDGLEVVFFHGAWRAGIIASGPSNSS
jgi:hypothetical protein